MVKRIMLNPAWGLLVVAAAVGFGCGSDGKTEAPTGVGPDETENAYSASLAVTSDGTGTVETESGAALQVPLYAVPLTSSGALGAMVFSIERDLDANPTLPDGATRASDVYRLGPTGFTFERMLQITLPVTGSAENRCVTLYRVDETTGASERYGGVYDTEAQTIRVGTYELSPWYVATTSPASTSYGAFHVTNSSTNSWLKLCVVDVELAHPDVDADFTGDAQSAWAPQGATDWESEGLWFLPQGIYAFCAELQPVGSATSLPGESSHFTIQGRLDDPWSPSNPLTTILPTAGTPEEGGCDCTPEATPSMGTGEVQVSLSWFADLAVDLDLWVTEPSGEKCGYSNVETETGGRLDYDNKCSNFVSGRPENIYYTEPPLGEFVVQVDYFSDCNGGPTSVPYEVRVVNGDEVTTYTGTLTPDPRTYEVCRFQVGELTDVGLEPWIVTCGPYRGIPAAPPPPIPKD